MSEKVIVKSGNYLVEAEVFDFSDGIATFEITNYSENPDVPITQELDLDYDDIRDQVVHFCEEAIRSDQ